MRGNGARVARFVVLGCALVAALVLWWPPTGGYSYAVSRDTLYDRTRWIQVALLTLAGVGLIVATSRPLRRAAAIVGVAAGLQLMGTGIVAHRRWYTSGGFSSPASNMRQLRSLAALLAIVGLIAVAACLRDLWREGAVDRRPRRTVATAAFVVAVVVALWVPFALGYEAFSRRTQVGAHGLMYGLPWAGVIALTGWLDRRTATVGLVTVILSAMSLPGNQLVVLAPHAKAGMAIAAVACVIVIASRWVEPRTPRSPLASSPSG